MKHIAFTLRQLILMYGALKVVQQHIQLKDEEQAEISKLIEYLESLLQSNDSDTSQNSHDELTYEEYLDELCAENTKKYGPC